MITAPPHRRIRSFVRRESRLTPKQHAALELLWEKYVVPDSGELLDLTQIFARNADTILEIGFGMGHSLLALAKVAPEKNFLGIEVYRPGIGALLAQLEANNITNVRVLCADAALALPNSIPEGSLAGIQIFFPDPWPKKRHHKRRLIQAPFVELLAGKLQPGAYLHLATDWEDYAQHMLKVLSAAKDLCNVAGPGQFATNHAERPLTKYEQRGVRLGHGVWDLLFSKASS